MKLLTLARDLRRRKARERQQLFVTEGVRAIEELLRSSLTIQGLLAGPQLLETPRGRELIRAAEARHVTVEHVSEREFASAAETESPQGVLAIATIPERGFSHIDVGPGSRVLILDAVQDPGNVGTILRTAAALSVDATVALPGTVDLWNAKVVRSSMGAHFHHPAFHGTWDDIDRFRRDNVLPLWAADAGGEPVGSVAPPPALALVVGNEGAGLSDEARTRADQLVALEIDPTVESLNVAVATGILLHSLRA